MASRTAHSGLCALLGALAFSMPAALADEENRLHSAASGPADDLPLRIVVMDPLSARLACDCVAGYARRDYDRLATFLRQRLGRPVEAAFTDYCTFIAGRGRILVTTQSGELRLLETSAEKLTQVSSLKLFADVPPTDREVWSHPALVGNRLYVRNLLAVYCFLLE